MTIGERIRQKRMNRNMSQQDVADFIGISKQYICSVEKGDKQPSLTVLIALANLFVCSTDEILGRRNIS